MVFHVLIAQFLQEVKTEIQDVQQINVMVTTKLSLAMVHVSLVPI